MAYAQTKGGKANPMELKRSMKDLSERLNSLIVRNILGDEAFYELWLKSDKTFEKAVEVSKKTK